MAEPVVTAATTIKGGAMVASGGLMASLVIFTDDSYRYLAIIGAIVSMFGVLHEVFGEHTGEYSCIQVCAEVIKGIALGLLAIPFWYLSITEGVAQNLFKIDLGQVSNSLSLIVSFALSWYTVPIFNWLSSFAIRKTGGGVDND